MLGGANAKLKYDNHVKEFINKGGAKKIFPILLLGIALLIFAAMQGGEAEEVSDIGEEAALAEMCSSIDGVGRSVVMITYAEGGESVFAVAVLCEGAESLRVRERLTDMIGSLYGIGANRISVLKIAK